MSPFYTQVTLKTLTKIAQHVYGLHTHCVIDVEKFTMKTLWHCLPAVIQTVFGDISISINTFTSS